MGCSRTIICAYHGDMMRYFMVGEIMIRPRVDGISRRKPTQTMVNQWGKYPTLAKPFKLVNINCKSRLVDYPLVN